MNPRKSKKGAFFFKYFFIFSAIVLVSFFIIGVSLMLFVGNFLTTQMLTETQNNAVQLADMSEELMSSDFIQQNPEGAVMVLCKNVTLMADSAGADIFICDTDGGVVICPETVEGFKLTSNNSCKNHYSYKIPDIYTQRVKHGRVSEFTSLGGIYERNHCVSMEPFYVNNTYTGFCVVATPLSGAVSENLENIFVMFVSSAAIALVIVTIVVYIMTGKIARPIRNMEIATNCYSSGDFTYRVPELKSNDELAHLVTRFNAMASSLSQLEDSRRSFIANVSHEFKTPMTTIGGFINGILDGTIPPEKQPYYLNIVSAEINRLSRMVTTMLNISKIETGNVDMTIEPFDISPKLVTTFLGFEQLISKKNIEVTGLEELEATTVHGDSAMIDQVIYNLVDNAVKFTERDGKITVNTATDKKYSYFAITNSGKGIPEADIDKVFDRFYKVDQSRSTDVKSTGLGLYLIKTIVNLHNGTITVESKPENYTRFTVKLPK